RTERKAAELASDLGLNYAPISQLAGYLANSDIILTCTNADKPIIMRSHLENEGNKLLIDLSIPSNVEPAVSRLSYIRLVNVDELSKVKDETFQKREQETYKAKMIIAEHLATFQDWYEMRKNAPMLKAIKTRLSEIAAIHQRELNNPQTRCPVIAAEQKIQQVINTVAGKMHDKKQAGCHFIEAVNDFLIAVEN
ncbi:MAG: hypothetical protein ABI166_15300, partial [Mucilaginibacter sp.]